MEDNCAVARKALRDFAAAVIAGRLFKQTAALAAGARRGVVVIEGTTSTVGQLGVSREALQGALIAVGVFYGLAVLRAADGAVAR